jgi:hypothetical protein
MLRLKQATWHKFMMEYDDSGDDDDDSCEYVYTHMISMEQSPP